MSVKLLTERFTFVSGKVVGNVVEGVLLCGAVSANNRRYLKRAFEGDRVKRYDGVPVNLNHGAGPDGRPYQEQIGTVTNPRLRSDGLPIGDIVVNPKKPYAEAFLWDAEHQPKACAMSHVAHCETSRGADGRDDVNELVSVESVDVISAGNAATTRGLYENRKGKTVSLTVKQLAEALVKNQRVRPYERKRLKWLAEMEGMDAAPSAMDTAPAEGADPKGALDQAFLDAALAEMQECMDSKGDPAKLKKCLGKLKKMLQAHAEITAEDGDDTDDGYDGGGADAGEPAADAKESKGILSALAVCEALQFRPDSTDLKLIARAAKSDREALAKRLKETAESTGRTQVTSAGRNSIDPSATGTGGKKTTEAAPPTDTKAFAEYIRSSDN
jgi:hypothetical protein